MSTSPLSMLTTGLLKIQLSPKPMLRQRINSLGMIAFGLLLGLASCDKSDVVESCPTDASLEGYNLVWSDEFEGTALDTSKWSYDIGDGCDLGENLCGWGNNELEYYTDRDENVSIVDGKLVITAIKEFPPYLGEHSYTSGRLVTKNKADWTYGRVDVRARLPIGQGIWPAIWMLHTDTIYGQWPKSGEIDIMENVGNEPSKVFGTIHYGHDFWRFTSVDTILPQERFTDDFHTFSVIWTENCIQFLLDGEFYGVPNTRSSVLPTTWPFDQDFHMIINMAVGGNLPGNPGPSTQFPQQMEVDFVKVYQKS
ncbi:MAG: family 16 glycosylhydrolase [Saprospiraceae bacterium]